MAIYREYQYQVDVQGNEVIEVAMYCTYTVGRGDIDGLCLDRFSGVAFTYLFIQISADEGTEMRKGCLTLLSPSPGYAETCRTLTAVALAGSASHWRPVNTHKANHHVTHLNV